MISWKVGLLKLNEWIVFQMDNNIHADLNTLELVRNRIWDMIFNLELEELKKSSDPADQELYNERIKAREVEWRKRVD